ncbi:MAG: TonB-dependent receptor [Acidobacteria bacterium]|nr:TonB-dependent receptor [Acidobacteriota bacterium]
MPPKSSIREVRINQNPFSAEYDRLGFGRIEVFTKPGSDRLRGQAHFIFGDESLNSRNPFSPNRAPHQLRLYGGSLGGPLSKRSSFFVATERREIDENAVVRATILDDLLHPTLFSQSIVTPQRRLSLTPRIDYQLNPNHTIVLRYQDLRSDLANQGIGQFSLASRAVDTADRDHILQLTETAVLSARAINETRVQFIRSRSRLEGDTMLPTIQVLDAFTGGGAHTGVASNWQDRFEAQNLTSITSGTHLVKFGARMRASRLSDSSNQNFTGTFTFAGGPAPQLDANHQIVRDASGQPAWTMISSLERYRRTLLFQQRGFTPAQIRQLGGGASQFTLSAGNPLASVRQVDLGVFIEDSWRLRPNLTLNYGLRYETQTNLSDRRSLAPRLSLAWGLDGGANRQTKTVLRAGFGVFYDRFPESLVLQTIRFDGARQQQYFMADPDFFPNVPSAESLAGSLAWQAQRRVESDLRAPYIAQSVIGLDRQLPWKTTLAAHFVYSRGVHMLRTRNINAPLPGTGTRPYGDTGNVYAYESSGILKQRQLLLNFNSRFNPRVMLFGFYVHGRANSDTDGAGSFPVNQYDLSSEYGRSSYDVRHRFLLGGSLRTRWGLNWTPFILTSSGLPFNIITGRDNNQDTIFNDRPSLRKTVQPDLLCQRKEPVEPHKPGPAYRQP